MTQLIGVGVLALLLGQLLACAPRPCVPLADVPPEPHADFSQPSLVDGRVYAIDEQPGGFRIVELIPPEP